MAAAEAGSAMASDRVDFVYENNAGGVLLALNEQVPHARRADAHEHFDEVRTRDRKERDARLPRDCARQQGLAGARRTDQQHSLWNAAAQPGETLRIFQ